jgi:hypothetical protein
MKHHNESDMQERIVPPLAASPAPSTCKLCSRPLGDAPVVRTTDGGRVHIICADHAGQRAYLRRLLLASGTGGLALALLAALVLAGAPMLACALLTVLVTIWHIYTHHRWWRTTHVILRRWMRKR